VDCFFEDPKNCWNICQKTIYNLKSELPNNPSNDWWELIRELMSFARFCCGGQRSDVTYELLSDEQYNKDVQSITEGLRTPFSTAPDKSTVQSEIAKIDRKIERISSAIEESDESPVTLVKRLAELEKERSLLMSQAGTESDSDADSRILAEADRLRHHILNVLKNEKSSTDELRNALSLFIHSVVIYRDRKVIIRHALPGMVASTMSGPVSAPLRAFAGYSQLLESVYVL
jgi:hypothetical protein